jgi:hypothetical protein
VNPRASLWERSARDEERKEDLLEKCWRVELMAGNAERLRCTSDVAAIVVDMQRP